MKVKFRGKRKKIKDQFVLVVGDDGAILCHYMENKLANRIFLESPDSADINLFEKLLDTYQDHPISILVDVIEQNFTQSVLPPVSKMGVVSQVQRRIRRDLRQDDLNNYMLLGRLKEGRRDWSVLFISLANADPYKKWADFVMKVDNRFDGIYLLPIEATKINEQLRVQFIDKTADKNLLPEWEILILHNKCGGFRIVVFKEGKIIFTRLAQNIIGDSIPEVVVGNLEQEIQNTFEYIKRLGFRNDVGCRTTIITAAEILEKIDVKYVKFGEVCLLSPFQASEILGLPDSVAGMDKFADVLAATHFAASNTHLLKFHNKSTKKLEQIYLGMKAISVATIIVLVAGTYSHGKKVYEAVQLRQEIKGKQSEVKKLNMSLVESKDKLKKFEIKDMGTILSAYNIRKNLPPEKYQALKILAKISKEFGRDKFIDAVRFKTAAAKNNQQQGLEKKNISEFRSMAVNYEMFIDLSFQVEEESSETVKKAAETLLKNIQAALPGHNITYDKEPKVEESKNFESLTEEIDEVPGEKTLLPATIKIEYNGPAQNAFLNGGSNA